MGYNDEKNQGSIIRQSQLKLSLEYCKMIGVPVKMKELVGITNVLTEYCQNGYSKEIASKLDKIDDYLMKKFEE